MEYPITDSVQNVQREGTGNPISEQIDTGGLIEPGNDLVATPISYENLVTETINNFTNKALEKLSLPKDERNMKNVLSTLSKKLDLWLLEGIILDSPDEKFEEKGLEAALESRGLEKTAENYKKIITMLLNLKE